jgi:hypothetical protein
LIFILCQAAVPTPATIFPGAAWGETRRYVVPKRPEGSQGIQTRWRLTMPDHHPTI